jgi:hypothetical protein
MLQFCKPSNVKNSKKILKAPDENGLNFSFPKRRENPKNRADSLAYN